MHQPIYTTFSRHTQDITPHLTTSHSIARLPCTNDVALCWHSNTRASPHLGSSHIISQEHIDNKVSEASRHRVFEASRSQECQRSSRVMRTRVYKRLETAVSRARAAVVGHAGLVEDVVQPSCQGRVALAREKRAQGSQKSRQKPCQPNNHKCDESTLSYKGRKCCLQRYYILGKRRVT